MTAKNDLVAAIGRSAASGVVARIVQVATRLVTVPIVISHLGVDGYGIWSIIMTTAAYMRFGSVGIKCAFQKYVAEATGTGKHLQASQLLSTGCSLMLLLSAIGLAPVAFFSSRLACLAGVPHPFMQAASGSISALAAILFLSNAGAVYEAIVMGGHRVDITRNFSTILTIVEAVAIVVLLRLGKGLVAMSAVMGISQLCFVCCCYVASKRIVPQVRVGRRFVTRTVVPELLRFAGTYQLANILEVLYLSIVPLVILKEVGAYASGLYAVTTRLVSAAQMLPDALLLPLLSGGAMVFASGSSEQTKTLIAKSFKVTLGLSLLPMAFLAAFGGTIVHAWTGKVDPSLGHVFFLVCVAAFAQAFSILGLVLYRASGRGLLDNVRQVMRIAVLCSTVIFARKWGLYGLLAGLAFAEAVGAVFMLFAITRTFAAFRLKSLLPDAARVTFAGILVFASGWIASQTPFMSAHGARSQAIETLMKAALGCLVAIWPAISLTKAINSEENNALVRALGLRRSLCSNR